MKERNLAQKARIICLLAHAEWCAVWADYLSQLSHYPINDRQKYWKASINCLNEANALLAL